LTSRNLRPRSEVRSLKSSSSRGGSARPSRPSSSLSNSSMPPTNAVAGPSSSVGRRKRERSGSLVEVRRKRARAWSAEEEEEVDELQDEPLESASDAQDHTSGPSLQARETSAQEDEVKTILLPSSADSSLLQEESPPKRSPVTSPSLAKLLHPEKTPSPSRISPTEVTVAPGPILKASRSPTPSRMPIIINSPTEFTIASGSKLQRSLPSPPPSPPRDEPEPLSAYSCPICFFPPTNATLTPCGHVCCGACLFTAVKTMTQRGAMLPEASVARCPVCRAQIPGWDGRGGGVIGLKVRAVFSL